MVLTAGPRVPGTVGGMLPDHSAPAADPVDVYLDVDGVINAVALSTPPDWGWGESRVVRAGGGQVRYSPELVDRLNALADRPQVTMHFLTTWDEDAATDLCPAIGLRGRSWRVLGVENHYSREPGDGWWKHQTLVDYLPARTGRAVWVDDDIPTEPAAVAWAGELGDRMLLVAPLFHRGLTRADMEQIEEFIGRHVAG